MIREVDLVDYYLPPFMQTYKEPVATLDAEQPEFQLVWKATDRVLYNRFISTADEYGISRFEKILGIFPSSEDTLESRRSRVQSKWFTKTPYTWRVLLEKLMVLCDDTDFVLTNNFSEGYTLTLVTDLELYGQVEELESIINMMIPENIVIDSRNNIPCNAKGVVLFCGGVCFTNIFTVTNDFREVYEITGKAGIGGSAAHTSILMVTNDFRENNISNGSAVFGGTASLTDSVQVTDAFQQAVSVNGNVKIGGGISETAILKITQDFDEAIRADGAAKVGGGIVQVDFIEIQNNS